MNKWISRLAGLCFVLTILLTSIQVVCFQPAFFQYEYHKNQTSQALNISQQDLMKATNTLLEYTQGKRENMIVKITQDGFEKEAFDQRETAHMVDVKNLYQNAMRVRNVFLVMMIICYGYLFLKKMSWQMIFKGYQMALCLVIMMLAAIGIWGIVDFNSFWLQFHYVFFTNDLFFLDPNISLMINMFPETFFFDMVFALFIFNLTCYGCVYLGFWWKGRIK